MSDAHRLDCERTDDGGWWAVCSCGDFRAWIDRADDASELALLTIHQVHVDYPEIGSTR